MEARSRPHDWRNRPSRVGRRALAPSAMKKRLWPRPLLRGISHQVWIRTATGGDVERLADYFGALSSTARYNRFMGAASNFTRMALECLVPLRPSEGFTLVAESREAEGDAIIGEASYGFD